MVLFAEFPSFILTFLLNLNKASCDLSHLIRIYIIKPWREKAGFLFTSFVELCENASLYYNVKFWGKKEKSEDLQLVKRIPESSIVRK